jgi:hypothetical protein
MDRRGTAYALSVGIAVALCGCSGQIATTATRPADGGGTGTSSGSSPEGPAGGGGTGTSSGSSPEGALCAATPAQLLDFNALANQLGAVGIGATQLAADATSIYLVFGGALLRVPIQGGSFSTLLKLGSPNVTQNNDPIATSTAVVFHHVASGPGNDEEIVSVPKAGGPPKTLATSQGALYALAATDSAVYFVDQGGLQSVPLTGGGVRVLSDAILAQAGGLAVVGSSVVVTTSNAAGSSGAVYSVPIAGGTPTMLATQQPSASFPMACGSDVCWWTGAPSSPFSGPTGPGFIARLANGQVTTISAPVFPWSLSFDGTDFYETVGCDICPGTLVRIPASGAPAVTMATAGFAVVEGACVYFSVALGFDLPSSYDGGIPGSGIYAVSKSYADPMFQRDM